MSFTVSGQGDLPSQVPGGTIDVTDFGFRPVVAVVRTRYADNTWKIWSYGLSY